MRLLKDETEQALMLRAATISGAAHVRAMRAARPGMFEYELEAELLYAFRKSGAQFPAYTPIVASGANACVLHYSANNAHMRDGDLVLIDAGCEFDSYAADITRTFPVNGRFTRAAENRCTNWCCAPRTRPCRRSCRAGPTAACTRRP